MPRIRKNKECFSSPHLPHAPPSGGGRRQPGGALPVRDELGEEVSPPARRRLVVQGLPAVGGVEADAGDLDESLRGKKGFN